MTCVTSALSSMSINVGWRMPFLLVHNKSMNCLNVAKTRKRLKNDHLLCSPKLLKDRKIFNMDMHILSAYLCLRIIVRSGSVSCCKQDIWASTRENLSSGVCEQHRRRPACASAQSDQRLCYSLFGKHHM